MCYTIFMINLGKENEYIEFKKSTSELKEGLISICSILNKTGEGILYFGVKDNGDAIGQEIEKDTLRDIERRIKDNIKPDIFPIIDYLNENKNVIFVRFSGFNKPYSCDGRYYIRISDVDRMLSVDELIKLKEQHSFDNNYENLVSEETLDDIDEDLLKEYILRANRCERIKYEYTNKLDVLKKLNLIKGDHLLNAGKILFSKNKPLTLKLAVFKSDERLSFIDTFLFEGNLFELLKKG